MPISVRPRNCNFTSSTIPFVAYAFKQDFYGRYVLQQELANRWPGPLRSPRSQPDGKRTVRIFRVRCLCTHGREGPNSRCRFRWNVVVREEELSAWVDEVVKPYESNRDASSTAPERKRRREASVSQGSTSNSTRTPSPEDCRHRRASDAAALLLGRNNPKKERSSHGSSTSTPHSMRSASTSPSSQPPSSCSSHMCSPMSGLTTPGTPATPASTGPVTPDRAAEHLAPAWYCSTDAHAKDAVKVPSNLSHRADSNEVLC